MATHSILASDLSATADRIITSRPAPAEITLVCEAWSLGLRERGGDAPISLFANPALNDFYLAARFGETQPSSRYVSARAVTAMALQTIQVGAQAGGPHGVAERIGCEDVEMAARHPEQGPGLGA
jgi:hypothetical protein